MVPLTVAIQLFRQRIDLDVQQHLVVRFRQQNRCLADILGIEHLVLIMINAHLTFQLRIDRSLKQYRSSSLSRSRLKNDKQADLTSSSSINVLFF